MYIIILNIILKHQNCILNFSKFRVNQKPGSIFHISSREEIELHSKIYKMLPEINMKGKQCV